MINIFKPVAVAVALAATMLVNYEVKAQARVNLDATLSGGGNYAGYGETHTLDVNFANQSNSIVIPVNSLKLFFNLPDSGVVFADTYTAPAGWVYTKVARNKAQLVNTTIAIAVPDVNNDTGAFEFHIPVTTVAPGTPPAGYTYSWGVGVASPGSLVIANAGAKENTSSGTIIIKNEPLPVDFSNFTATAKGCTVVLNWSTATEINNSHFVVERSNNGSTFKAIGQTNGAGTSYEAQSYTYIDQSPANLQNMYRIRQVDFDGKTTTSVVRNANLDCNINAISMYPNPATSNVFYVKGLTNKSVIEVYNAVGQRVVSKSTENTLEGVSLSGLASGVYHVQVISEGQTVYSNKLIKD